MDRETEELSFFNKLAEEWWNPNGPQAMLHKINPLRLRWISQNLQVKGLKILDVGCGAGLLTEGLAKMGAEMSGLDLAPKLIQIAREHAQTQNLNIQYHEKRIEDFAATHPAAFDAICCLEMLEHVEDYNKIIQAIASLLKPGGMVFLSTIDRSPKAFLELILGAEYLLKMIPRGTHHYSQFIRPSELTHCLRQNDLSPISLLGLSYHFLSKSFSLNTTLKPNYWLIAKK